jgi:TolB-like protein/lipoprotein NlpI
MNLLSELKRRNVFKVAAAYVIVGWLVMQVGEVMAPALHLPEWINSALAFFIILGFPFALFFAWAFEMTPEGLKKEKDVDRSQSITGQTGKKLNHMITGLLVLALAYFAFDKFVLDPGRDQAEIAAAVESAQEDSAATARAPMESPDRSIAVLPFVNMSSDPEQEYFSDGITEELLNLLAKIPELRVAARTSSFSFKGQNVEIPLIAERLGVAHILEGSVRKAGDQIRITAQLIQADNGFHLWSETYDRQLDNIFAIQDEISAAVVDALKVTLLGEAPKSQQTDPEAYRLYLEGQYFFNQRSQASLIKAAELLERAVAIAPDYAPAWGELAFVQLWMGASGGMEIDESIELAEHSTMQALELDPNLSLAHTTRAIRYIFYDFEFERGLQEYKRALDLDPGGALGLGGYGIALKTLGRFDESVPYMLEAMKRDPLVPETYNNLGTTYLSMSEWGLAESNYLRVIELSPEYVGVRNRLARLYLFTDQPQKALDIARQERDDEVYRPSALSVAYYSLGDQARSDQELARLIEQGADVGAYQIAQTYAWRGETDEAFNWLQHGLEIRDSGLAAILGDWTLQSLWDDPRWEVVLKELKMWDTWQALPPEWGGPQ